MCNCKHTGVDGHFCCHESKVQTLGLVAAPGRKIHDGTQFDNLFPKANLKDKIVNPNGSVKYTVDQMERVVSQHNWQTQKLAKELKRPELSDTLALIWSFLHRHLKYKLDKEGVEELRTPARAWHDGQILARNPNTAEQAGIDCDCFSIFTSSILTNLKINHKLRITKYSGGWQHVYVVIPVPNKPQYHWIIDCVLDKFNIEKTYTDKFDHTMNGLGIPVAILSGTNDADELHGITSGSDFDLHGFGSDADTDADLGALKRHLLRTRNYIAKNPHSVVYAGGAKNNIKMIDHVLNHWNTPYRMQALNDVAEVEHGINVDLGLASPEDFDVNDGMANPYDLSGFIEGYEEESLNGVNEIDLELSGLMDDTDEFGEIEELGNLADDVDVLGKPKGPKKFLQNVRKAAGTIAKKAAVVHKKVVKAHINTAKKVGAGVKKAAKKTAAATKKVAKKVAVVAKKALKAVVRYNPLTATARGGFLLVLKLGWFDLAWGLRPALWSKEDAAKKGISAEKWTAATNAYAKVKKIFVDTLQGKEENLKKNIIEGAKKRGLGVVVAATTATSVTAASVPVTSAASAATAAGVKAKDGTSILKKVVEFFKKNGKKIADGIKKLKANRDAKKEAKKASQPSGGEEAQVEETQTTTEETTEDNSGRGPGGGDGGKEESGKENPAGHQDEYDGGSRSEAPGGEAATEEGEDGMEKVAEAIDNAANVAESVDSSTEESGPTNGGSTPTTKPNNAPKTTTNDESEGFFTKIGNFVKANPGKTVAGIAVVGLSVAMAIPSSRKAIVGLFTKKKSGLSGVKKRKKKSKTTRRVVTPNTSYNKRKVRYVKM